MDRAMFWQSFSMARNSLGARTSIDCDGHYDTNLSKENCFALTGDPSATPGGRIDASREPLKHNLLCW